MNVILGLVTFLLVLVSLFLIIIVLMQKASSDAGMGSAMGGGMSEATFGAQSSSVLTKGTINGAIAFFVLSIILFLGRIYQHNHAYRGAGLLPTMPGPVPAFPAPATPLNPAPAHPAPPPAAAPSSAPAAPAPSASKP